MVGDGLDWCEYLNMDWKWVREAAHGWGGFKISKNELNMSKSGWERAENEWAWVKNE